MNILFAFPSRSRPERLERQMRELTRHLAQPDKCHVNFVIDDDDPKREQYLKVIEQVSLSHSVTGGKSENKIHAVNRAVSECSYQWDAVVVMSDDMRIVMYRFDDSIRKHLSENNDQLLHYNDGYANATLVTFAIMGRKYYDRFGFIYNPAYVSLWCDNEQMDIADWLGRRKYMPEQIVLHEHPANKHRHLDDAQYRKTESFYRSDEKTYRLRKADNFGLPLLSVCVCTVIGREKQFDYIYNKLINQSDGMPVEVLFEKDNKEISVGAKRQKLLERAQGKFVCFVDDDDDVSGNYIAAIIYAIKEKPGIDCIGFLQHATYDGKNPEINKLSLQYSQWGDNIDGFAHVRTPYHKTPILLSKVVQCGGFKDMRYSEDHDFSKRVYELLRSEAFIEQELYYYKHKTENHKTKYGIE